MRIVNGLVAAIVLFALSACAPGASVSVTRSVTIDNSFQSDGVTWRGGSEHTYIVFRAQEYAGLVEVCGAIVTYGSGLIQSAEPQVLQGAFIRINGVRIANSITYFGRLPRQGGEASFSDIVGKSARCATTGAIWQDDFKDADIELILRFKSVQI